MTIRAFGCLSALLATLAAGMPVAAQDPAAAAQNKLLARRAAEADCYRKLAETVYGVQITSDTYVRDFVAESDEIRSAVDTFVKGIRLGPPRYYEDGTCEVDAEVTVANMVTEIKRIHKEHYKGRVIHTTDIEHIKDVLKTKVIRVTGAGAPRPDLPAGLPEGIEDVITAAPATYLPARSIPPIWRSVPAQARLMAQRSARVVAMRKLLERIKGLRLTSSTLVRDFITESDEIAAHADGLVLGAAEVGLYLHSDELIAEVTLEVEVEKVIEKIKELYTEYYRGHQVTSEDITDIQKTAHRRRIRATGAGVPPSRFLAQARSAGVDFPDWMERQLRATGQGTDDAIDTAQGKLRAARAAEIEAMRQLADQVYGLSVSASMTVRNFLTRNEEITTQVEAVISGAIAGPPSFSGDTATVTVSMPAAEVWSVVHQHLLIIKRRG